jgi:hypothetical protein
MFLLSSATAAAYRVHEENLFRSSHPQIMESPPRTGNRTIILANLLHQLPCPPALHVAFPSYSIPSLTINYLKILRDRADGTVHNINIRQILLVGSRHVIHVSQRPEGDEIYLDEIYIESRIDKLHIAFTDLKRLLNTQSGLNDLPTFNRLERLINHMTEMFSYLPPSHITDASRMYLQHTAMSLTQCMDDLVSQRGISFFNISSSVIDHGLNRFWNDCMAKLNDGRCRAAVKLSLTFSKLSRLEQRKLLLGECLIVFSVCYNESGWEVEEVEEEEEVVTIDSYLCEWNDDIVDY